MKKLFALLALVLITIAAKPGGGGGFPWNLTVKPTSGNVTWKYKGDGLQWTFPPHGNNQDYPTFVTTTIIPGLTGNLTSKTLSATYTITETGSPQYVYGGLFSGWNNCPRPANIRFFISTKTTAYDNQCLPCYWWSWASVDIDGGTWNLTDTIDPATWWGGSGGWATNDLANFQAAVANVRQCGIAISGGCFFDVGVAVLSGSGTASFTLNSFTAQ